MELLLELRVGSDRAAVRLDCRVEVEPEATVADLRRALGDHAAARGVAVAGGALLRDDHAHPLGDDHLVSGTRLRSGSRLWLGIDPPRARPVRDPAVERPPDRSPPWESTVVPPLPAAPERPRWTAIRSWPERAAYLAALDDRVAELERAVEEERSALRRRLPPFDRLPEPWSRHRSTPDLLTVRLGTGAAPAGTVVEVEPGGDEELRRTALDRLSAAGIVRDVPIALGLDAMPIVGLHGSRELVDGLARSVLMQVVALHRPEDVVIAALLAPPALRSFEWLRWLPHVRSSTSPLPDEHLAAWPDDVPRVCRALVDTARRPFPRVVVVVDEDAPLERDDLDRLIDLAGSSAIRVLWIGRDPALVPPQCRTVVRVGSGPGGSLLSERGLDPVEFDAEVADIGMADGLARRLAPLRGPVPRAIGLAEVLGGTPAPAGIAAMWSVSDGGLLDAPVGADPLGAVTLDLVEDGPHALVAGAPGSGKTELVRSWVSALSARHPPERLGFVILDHAGDLSDRPFGALPHALGDVQLQPELARRAAMIEDRRVGDFTELAAADPTGCPPRLVVVVDELAAVLDGSPGLDVDLMAVAQQGGHVGVHLVVALSTESPPVAAIADLLADCDLRIALRVGDPSPSEWLVGTGGAAEIPASLPGRALARIPDGRLLLFQTAWSGAARRPVDTRRVRVATLGFGHRGGADEQVSGEVSQLDDVLRAVELACERSGRR